MAITPLPIIEATARPIPARVSAGAVFQHSRPNRMNTASNSAPATYEIKHSNQCVREQARHLLDEGKLRLISPRFGRLAGRFVLYLGESMDTKDGIAYRNAEQFLKRLPEIALESGLEGMML